MKYELPTTKSQTKVGKEQNLPNPLSKEEMDSRFTTREQRAFILDSLISALDIQKK